MVPQVEVYQVPDGPREGLWSFRVDGKETKYYSPTEHGIRRVVERLQKGRAPSLSAALTQSVAVANQARQLVAVGALDPATNAPYTLETAVAAVQASTQRVRVGRAAQLLPAPAAAPGGPAPAVPQGWAYTLDGRPGTETYRYEAQAKAAGAFAAFLSRGNLAAQ